MLNTVLLLYRSTIFAIFAGKFINMKDKVTEIGNSERTIVHLALKEGGKEKDHYYFGSLARIFDDFTPEQIGVSYNRLRNFRVTSTHPYENKFCIIRKGVLLSKKGNRGKRKDVSNAQE